MPVTRAAGIDGGIAPARHLSVVRAAAETLFPGYFALVMATAAVSIASFLLGHGEVAHVLVGLNWIFYISLWVLTLVRRKRRAESRLERRDRSRPCDDGAGRAFARRV